MKRTLIIVAFFVVMSVFFIAGCTCNCDGDVCRGLGFECIAGFYEAFDFACGSGSSPNLNKTYNVASLGEDFGKPKATVLYDTDDEYIFKFEVEIYNKITDISYEVCIIQDGVLLYTYTDTLYDQYKDINVQETISLPKYNPDGGEVECIVNKFEAYNEG